MTQKLPALPAFREVVAIEALAFAHDLIAADHRNPKGIFHPDAKKLYGKYLMKEYARVHPFNCDEICYFAANGSKEADLALRELYAERSDRGEDPGVVLKAYIIRLINPARGRSGPGKAADFIRDMGITLLLQALMDRFKDQLPMNRSSDSAGPSFSSVAAQALCEAKIGILMDFKNVQKIWQKYLPIVAGTRYAVRTRFADGIPPDCKRIGIFD